jgi:hypothetical protein
MALECSERLALFVRDVKPSADILHIERSPTKENEIAPLFCVPFDGFILGDGESTLELFVDFSTLQPAQDGPTASGP